MSEADKARALRMRQRKLLAELGTLALRTTDLDGLLQEACRVVAEGVGVRFCKVLELLRAENRLLVRAGVGWKEGVIGHAKLGADDHSPAGHALRTGEPVVSNDLATEPRFRTPQLLIDHGIDRAMNVIIQEYGRPFGVLEVDSRDPVPFLEEDISFLQGAANLLGFAIERSHHESELKREIAQHELLLREADHRIKNSLQLIASLLTLQRSRLADPQGIDALTNAIARVTAVAETHRWLHQSRDLRSVPIDRMLADLCAHVGKLSAIVDVTCHSETGVSLDAERAIPLGLIITELLMNASRHAYPDDRHGTVRLGAAAGDGHLEITISDQGVGLAGQNAGFGTMIVNALVRQIGAELHTSSEPGKGTEVRLRLPLQAERRE